MSNEKIDPNSASFLRSYDPPASEWRFVPSGGWGLAFGSVEAENGGRDPFVGFAASVEGSFRYVNYFDSYDGAYIPPWPPEIKVHNDSFFGDIGVQLRTRQLNQGEWSASPGVVLGAGLMMEEPLDGAAPVEVRASVIPSYDVVNGAAEVWGRGEIIWGMGPIQFGFMAEYPLFSSQTIDSETDSIWGIKIAYVSK